LASIFCGISRLAKRFPEVAFVFPVHRNPHVVSAAQQWLHDIDNVYLLEPLVYPAFVWLMDRAKLIVTDSGGVQEEAPSLGKPVLVTREVTERPEAWEAGALLLVGTSSDRIEHEAVRLLTHHDAYRAMQIANNPYGDGAAAQRIVDEMYARYLLKSEPSEQAIAPPVTPA
jgi:UDP-N-acetylglucosamine 2-epimerase (non-hydrolysing)